MAQVLITEQYLTDTANAIRSKLGVQTTYKPREFAAAIESISGGQSPSINLQDKTVSYTPSENAQSETLTADSGYDGLSSVGVSVAAVPTTYVGSGITRRSSSNLTASGATVTVPSGYYSTQATKSVSTTTHPAPTASINASTGLVTASHTQTAGYVSAGTTTGTLQLTTQAATTITPSTSSQTAVAAGKYTTGAVTVGAIPSSYVQPSGTKTITENGTGIDVANYASVDVAVASSGGATNYVSGTFTTSSTSGVQTISIPYTGSGYPIAAMIFIAGGAYNSAISDWYTSTQRYAVGQWTMHKSVQTSAPTYASGTQNQGVTTAIYKNSTSNSTSYTRTSAMNTNVYNYTATNAALTCVRIASATSLSVYVASTSYGLKANTEYAYHIIYSS